MHDLTGKRALVTGAGRGIGRGIAVELARAGAAVAVNDRPDSDDAAETVRLIEEAGGRGVFAPADVTDAAAVEVAVAKTVADLGGLDLFVSNAAHSDREPILDADMADFRRTVDVTLWGAVHGVRAAGRHMRDEYRKTGRGGAMLVVSSPHAEIPFPNAAAYNTAKAGLDQFARTAATEFFHYDIRVNLLHPGWVDTPGERRFFTEEQLAEGAKALPFGRLGNVEELGKAAVYLLSDDAAYMTGSTLSLEGGVKLPYWSKRAEGGQ